MTKEGLKEYINNVTKVIDEAKEEILRLVEKNTELEQQIERMKEQLCDAKDRYDRAADKTPVRACGAEYRLFCDIESMLEDWEAAE